MDIILDGYNILKQNTSSKRQEEAFLDRLAFYGKSKGHTIVVVFDGGLCTWPMQEQWHGLTILYSGVQTADDVIKKNLLMRSKVFS